MASPEQGKPVFVIIGAGAVGGFMAALLHQAGYEVRVLLRPGSERGAVLRETGLVAKCSADATFEKKISPAAAPVVFGTDASAALVGCSCVLVATKRTSNREVQKLLTAHVDKGRPTIFLQNGLNIRKDFIEPVAFEVIESVVNFNVTQDLQHGAITLTQPMADAQLILDGSQPSSRRLAEHLGRSSIQTFVSGSFAAVQRGKLQLNMTNAVNALSGLAIAPMFFDAGYRKVLAASMVEAIAVFKADGVVPEPPVKKDAFLLRWFTTLLVAPQWLFVATVGQRLKGRGDGRTSLAQDLQAHRVPTEIEFLNGAIVDLGRANGVATPVNERLLALVKEAEVANKGCPGISGLDLLQKAGLAAASPSSNVAWAAPAALLGILAAYVIARSNNSRL